MVALGGVDVKGAAVVLRPCQGGEHAVLGEAASLVEVVPAPRVDVGLLTGRLHWSACRAAEIVRGVEQIDL